MSKPFPEWLHVPSRVALLLGLSALSATGVRADTNSALSPRRAEAFSENKRVLERLTIWSDNGRLYISDAAGAPELLDLGDTPETRSLHRLLQERGAVGQQHGMGFDRMILAGGGGDGFHWAPAKARNAADPGIAGVTTRSKRKSTTREQGPSAKPIGTMKTTSDHPGVKG